MDAPSVPQHQHVIVLRHGDRLDDFLKSWTSKSARPWDPPLHVDGHVRAFKTGLVLQPNRLNFRIHRVISSPFLRCVETAAHVISGLCSVDEDSGGLSSTSLDPSKIKASIEYGLCEILHRKPNRLNFPEDWDWGFNLSELEQKLPAGTVDPEFKPVIPELPKREEELSEGVDRFTRVTLALADKYPSDNLLLVTHGAGLRSVFPMFMKGMKLRDADYCSRFELRREINDISRMARKFSVVSYNGLTPMMKNDS
ncbi:hypothetical protein SAY87_024906 [Trapa incisa]|uniref:Phosphoglycerate mutase family protein n=1 Tax=Trapa incisa TaxID=236973 RepID=A0AAN7GKM0_9MYRT|nr:hypothetical protein SAY87_024906 [Trapa incisa]